MKLSPVISLDEEKCINCHACITICPVKFCNDGSSNVVKINPDLCIGCGQCIKACTHKARTIIDDFEAFMTDISKRTNMIAIVAPAVAAVFPHQYLNFNGWLKSIGISASFDVSFGAELTIKSYLEHVKENNPKMVIAQPCPALVTYIEIYRPELIPYLAPADSPMLHTARMVKRYYPQYSNYKIAVMSPCAAKKREFEETHIGDYNVTFHSIKKYFQDKNINLNSYSPADYDNPPAERAVLFSTPGGLLRTAERWNSDIKNITRKIEGPHIIYEYLDHLPEMLRQGKNPVLIDCLNCDLGCNGGPATDNQHKSPDEVESLVEERDQEMIKKYRKSGFFSNHRTKKSLEDLVNKFWEPGLYRRNYVNLSGNLAIKEPSDKELKSIYALMEKYSEKDIYNCSSCGYGSCKNMATAIFNGLNKHENCHHYLAKQNEKALRQIEEEKIAEEEKSIKTSNANAELMNTITTINSSMEEMSISIVEISKNAQDALSVSTDASEKASNSVINVNKLKDSSMEIGNVVNIIRDTASQLHMLALNATIEASRAGSVGKGFAVVADEVKQLSMETARATKEIGEKISAIQTSTIEATKIMASIAEINKKIQEFQIAISTAVEEQSVATNEVKRSISDVLEKIAIAAHER